MRPIKPTREGRVRIEKWMLGTDFTRRFPWKVLTQYPDEPCYTLVASFPTWEQARDWALR
jgi:hypothetical protein